MFFLASAAAFGISNSGVAGLHYSQYKVTYSSGTPRKLPYYAKHVVHISTGLSLLFLPNLLYLKLTAELHLSRQQAADAGYSI